MANGQVNQSKLGEVNPSVNNGALRCYLSHVKFDIACIVTCSHLKNKTTIIIFSLFQQMHQLFFVIFPPLFLTAERISFFKSLILFVSDFGLFYSFFSFLYNPERE